MIPFPYLTFKLFIAFLGKSNVITGVLVVFLRILETAPESRRTEINE
jgi:hypothetical protein